MENITSKGTIFGTLIAQAGPKGDTGKTGDRGLTGEAGYSPIKGVDYFTQEDISEIRKGIEGDLTGEYNKNAIEKTNIFNTNAKETTTSFDLNAENKTKEYNDNALAEIEKYNSNAIEKSNNFDTNFENKTSKFDSNCDEKTKEFNDNNDLGIQNYNNNAKKQMEIFDTNFTEKLEAFNNNAGNKFNGFNTNSDKALAEYNKNHTAKMKEFDDNATAKLTAYNKNNTDKTNAYNANDIAKTKAYNDNTVLKEKAFNDIVTESTEAFNTNVEQKETEFEDLAEEKINEYNTNHINKTKEFNNIISPNLYNPTDAKQNVAISQGDGTEISFDGWLATGYIKVNNNDILFFSDNDEPFPYSTGAVYDSNKHCVTAFGNPNNNNNITITTDGYARFSFSNIPKKLQIEKDKRTSYIPFGELVISKDIEELQEKVTQIQNDITKTQEDVEKIQEDHSNLFNKDTVVKGAILPDSGYFDSSFTTWQSSDFIPVKPKTKLFFSSNQLACGVASTGAYYDKNKKYISPLKDEPLSITIPDNAYYIRFSKNGRLRRYDQYFKN